MTAPDNLTAWKAGLLARSDVRTRAYFRGESVERRRRSACRCARAKVVQARERRRRAFRRAVRALVDGIDPRLLTQLTVAPGRAPRQARRRRADQAAAGRARSPLLPDEGTQRARDRRAGCARRARHDRGCADRESRRRARRRARSRRPALPTAAGRLVIDTFYVRDLKGEAIADDDPRWTRLAGDLRELLAGAPDPGAVATLIARRRPQSGLPKRVTPGRDHRDPHPRRFDAGDDRRSAHARPRRRAVRDHADARRSRPRHLARESLDRRREGRRRVLRAPATASGSPTRPSASCW